MMSRSLSFCEPERLAHALVRAGFAATRPLEPASTGADPTGAPGAAHLVDASRSGRGRAAAFNPLGDGLGERLSELLEWAHRRFDLEAMVLLDQDGLPLLDDGAEAELAAFSAALLHAARQIARSLDRATPTQWVATLADGRPLYLLYSPSSLGQLQVGLLARRPLPEGTLRLIRQAVAVACGERTANDGAGVQR